MDEGRYTRAFFLFFFGGGGAMEGGYGREGGYGGRSQCTCFLFVLFLQSGLNM